MASTSSAVGFVQGHTCCPARVARCFRGRTCPYRKQVHGCWFRHDDEEDVEVVPLSRDVAASACSSDLVLAQIKELVSRILGLLDQIVDVPVPKVTGEIPVFVGVWEEIVDAIQVVPQEQVFEECVQNRVPEQIVGVPVPQLMEAVVEVLPQERVLNRTPEQIMDSPVHQITEEIVEVLPQERVQHLVFEQIVGSPVHQITEEIVEVVPQERVQNRILEQTVVSPVPQITEEIVDSILEQTVGSPVHQITEEIVERLQLVCDSPVPQIMEEIVEIRSPGQLVHVLVPHIMEAAVENRLQERIVNSPEPQFVEYFAGEQIAASKHYTGKVFNVNLRHHSEDLVSLDNVGFIKGLDKHNMPRLGDVMVPPPQIPKNSFFMKSPAAANANEPLYRFYQRYSGRSSRSKLHR